MIQDRTIISYANASIKITEDEFKDYINDKKGFKNKRIYYPMVKNFGDRTEVSQYRGRHVDEGGKCPIKIKRSNDENN